MLARILDQDAFANFLYVLAWGMIAVQLIDCAAEQCLLHFSRVVSRQPQEIWSRLIGLKLIMMVVFVAFAMLIEVFTTLRFPPEFLLLILPAFYLGPVYESQQRNVEYATIIFTERGAIFVSAAVIVWAGWGVSAIFLAYFVVSTASLTYQILNQSAQQFDIKPVGYWQLYLARYISFYFVLVAQLFYGNISRLIIEIKLGVLAFGAATISLQIINLISLIQTQIDKHIRPEIIEAVLHRQVGVIIQIVKKYLAYYVIPLAISAVVLSMFAESLMGLFFGKRWEDAGHALRVLSPLLITIACLRFLDILVVALDMGKMNLTLNIIAAAVLAFTLFMMPSDQDLNSYLAVIVIVQMLHVTSVSWLVFHTLEEMRS